MFEDRVEEAQKFVSEGNIKKAISTLDKAIANEPEKDVDGKVDMLIGELEAKLLEPKDEIEKETEIVIEDAPEKVITVEDDVEEEKPEDLEEDNMDEIGIQDGKVGVYTENPEGVCLMGTLLLPGQVREFKASWKDSLSTIPDIKIKEV